MELILFIYVLVAIVVTGHVLLTREKDVTGAITSADIARLAEWAKSGGHMPATPAATPAANAASTSDTAASGKIPLTGF